METKQVMEENDKLYHILQLAGPEREKAVQEAVDQLKLQAESEYLKAFKSLEQECQQ